MASQMGDAGVEPLARVWRAFIAEIVELDKLDVWFGVATWLH